MHTSFKHTMDARAWDRVGLHCYQGDPTTCAPCRFWDLTHTTRHFEERREVVELDFRGPEARRIADWVVCQLKEAQYDRIGKRLHRVVEVEHALLLARCAGAGWLNWIDDDDGEPR